MPEVLADVRVLLSTMYYVVEQDENGSLPHEIDFHYLMREMIKVAKGRLAEKELGG